MILADTIIRELNLKLLVFLLKKKMQFLLLPFFQAKKKKTPSTIKGSKEQQMEVATFTYFCSDSRIQEKCTIIINKNSLRTKEIKNV